MINQLNHIQNMAMTQNIYPFYAAYKTGTNIGAEKLLHW